MDTTQVTGQDSMMFPKERIAATIEYRPFDCTPIRRIGVAYSIANKSLGYKTLCHIKWQAYQTCWQEHRDEIAESYKHNIVTPVRKSESDVASTPLVLLHHSHYKQPKFLNEIRWLTIDKSECAYPLLTKGNAIWVKLPEMVN